VNEPAISGQWWRFLRELPQAQTLRKRGSGSTLLVLSESYARAMHDDLIELATCDGDRLLIGGWRDVEGLPRIAADRALRKELGGTASSLSLRMARRWMARRKTDALFTAADLRSWERWTKASRHHEIYDRTPQTDTEIVGLVRKLIRDDPELSATRALRRLRDSGIACEQKRFGAIFRDVKASR
jgi:hypothetical protein